jgi:hypothetical protein
MPLNKKPTAEYIATLANRLRTRYGPQDKLDQRMLQHYKLSRPKEMGDPEVKGEFELKSVDAGLVGFIVNQDVFVLNGVETIRVNAFGGADAEKWASQVAEPWLVGARKAARHHAAVEVKKRQDLRLYGRAWTTTLPAPQIWGGKDFDQGKEESNDDYNARVEKQKRSRFPITQSWVSARGTWPVFDENGDVAETVKIRKVDPEIIKSKFSDAKLPEDSSQTIEIIEYANHQWFAIAISSQRPEDSQELQVWDHHLGRHPDVLFEGEPLPEDPDNPGERWQGAAYHVLSMVETMNDLLSDARTASRMEVTAPTVVKQDPEKRAAAGAGKPEQLKLKAWDTINIFITEAVERMSVAGLNQAIVTLLSFIKPLLDQTALSRPSLIGSILSGQSSVALDTAAQRAVTELNVSQTSLEDGGAEECQLLFRSVVSLSERFPDIPDAVIIREADDEHGSREITMEPKHLLDWESLIQVKIAQNIPQDMGGALTNFAVGTKSKAFSRQTGRETLLDFEDPLGEEDKIKQEELDDVLHQGTIQFLQQKLLAGIQQQGALNPQELLDQSAASTPDIQEVLAQSFDEDGDAETGALIRGAMNRARVPRGQRQQAEGRELAR